MNFTYDISYNLGLFQESILKKSVHSIKSVPLKQWVGPERGDFCCLEKYRLNFDQWNDSTAARALQSVMSNIRYRKEDTTRKLQATKRN